MFNYFTSKTRVEQDDSTSVLIPMEERQPTINNPSSSVSSEPTIVDVSAVERTFLFEISANKEKMAHITKKSVSNQSKQYYLRTWSITYASTGPEFSADTPEKNITKYMQCVDEFTYSFLSLSPNGDRMAISFYQFDSSGKLSSEKPTCYVFRFGRSGVELELELEKKLKCQGKAVFTPDGYLAVVDKNTVNLYSCKKDYRLLNCLGIHDLFPKHELLQTEIYNEACHILWAQCSFHGRLDIHDAEIQKMLIPVQAILYLTRFIEQNLLVPCFQILAIASEYYSYEGICVWSLPDGVRSIPFSTEKSQEVLAISADKTLIATFGRRSPNINVHHLKSGLLVSTLKSEQNAQARQRFPLGDWSLMTLYYVYFSKDNKYVFLISIHDGKDKKKPNKALFMIEAWSRDTEKLIYQHGERINIDWYSKNTLAPYIVESEGDLPTFTAVYNATMSGNKTFKSKSLNLGLFDNNPQKWRIQFCPENPINEFMRHVCVMSLNISGKSYQARIGKYAFELWRLSKSENQETEDLIYIRAFQPAQYHQGEAYKEDWILEHYREDGFAIHYPDQLPSLGILCSKATGFRMTVSVKYSGNVPQEFRSLLNNAPTHQEEIYLPLNQSQRVHHHQFESACRALHFFYRKRHEIKEKSLEEADILYDQTKKLIIESMKRMKQEKSRYFTTISGSNTLAMLACFQEGRDILFQILQTEEFAINLFTYVRHFATTEKMGEFVNKKENALTVLIEKFDYELFDLLFNRILLFSTSLGVGAFCAITDTMIFLQGRGETIVFQKSCKKLKFLAMNSDAGQIARNQWDCRRIMGVDVLHKSNAEFTDFSSYATEEQISNCSSTTDVRRLANHLAMWVLTTIRRVPLIDNYYENKWCQDYYNSSVRQNLLSVCAAPFVHFGSYTIFWEDEEFDTTHGNRDDKTLIARLKAGSQKLLHLFNTEENTVHKVESDLMHLASNQHENDLFHQKGSGSVIEVLLYYKWRTFLRHRFYLVCFIHLVYYSFFISGVLFARECFAYTLGTSISNSPVHVFLIALMFAANLTLSIQELRQFLKMGLWKYIKSVYNIVDLAALVMPPICFWLMISDKTSLDEVCAITTIILWMHGILRLRPFASIGVTLETMVQLMKSVYKTLIIMLVVIFAFTHAFMVLLLHKDDSYFQEQYSGAINASGSEQTVNYSDASASNSFQNPFKAFSTLWLFIYGVWDPITDGDAGDDVMIIVFAMLFSFVTVLLFFNLVIVLATISALMSSKAEEVKALGKSIWVSHFAEVIAEIEQFWCFRSERINRKNSPSVVYYVAKYTDVRQQAETLEQECDALIKELQIKLNKRQERAGHSIRR
ncbi:hypothetical protein MBANPS3_006934 [Mucor bainieri]